MIRSLVLAFVAATSPTPAGDPLRLGDTGSYCVITGYCAAEPARPRSGLMFVAVGLVWVGVYRWRRADRR